MTTMTAPAIAGSPPRADPSGRAIRTIVPLPLGRVEYEDGLALQREAARLRREGLVPDLLLLLEHPHVLTLGRNADLANVVADAARRRALDVGVFPCDRGGDVTYHGPGQLVAYPIFDLAPDRRDVRAFVATLEEALIRTCAAFGVPAGRVEGLRGVWTEGEKIAALGVHISRWITSHGIALNVSTDLDYFSLIVPCGIRGRGVTSLTKKVGRPVSVEEAADTFARETASAFGAKLLPAPEIPVTDRVVFAKPSARGWSVLLREAAERPDARGLPWREASADDGMVFEPLGVPLAEPSAGGPSEPEATLPLAVGRVRTWLAVAAPKGTSSGAAWVDLEEAAGRVTRPGERRALRWAAEALAERPTR